jgi:hypothetical protein
MINYILSALCVAGAFVLILSFQKDTEMDEQVREALRYEQKQDRIRRAIKGDK